MNQTVLLVEDDASDSVLIRRAFEKAGIAEGLIRAKDGDDAVAYLDGSAPYQDRIAHPLPCLVLLDIKLPRRSGFEVLSWIRRDPRPLRRIPVIMLTSSRHSVDVNRAYELGANAYAVKPDTSAQLIELIQSVNTFWMQQNEFPITASAQPSSPPPQHHGPESQSRTILLIEDERSDAMLIKRALTRAGFAGDIEHALDGNLGLAWLRRHAENGNLPSLVLLDLKLPGISGFEVMEEIRRSTQTRQIPIVVLAASNDATTINNAYERGANSYLVKSPDPEEVNRLMSFLQHYWLHVNQNAFDSSRAPSAERKA